MEYFHYPIPTIPTHDFRVNSRINPRIVASTIGLDYLSMMAKRRPINSNIMPIWTQKKTAPVIFPRGRVEGEACDPWKGKEGRGEGAATQANEYIIDDILPRGLITREDKTVLFISVAELNLTPRVIWPPLLSSFLRGGALIIRRRTEEDFITATWKTFFLPLAGKIFRAQNFPTILEQLDSLG